MQADKGQALVTLAEYLGVPLERTAALGDGGNDPAMFQRAGLSIAMGQAEEQVKRQADVITGSNLEDGAAEASSAISSCAEGRGPASRRATAPSPAPIAPHLQSRGAPSGGYNQ